MGPNRVVVVGVIGSTSNRAGKSVITNNILDKEVFPLAYGHPVHGPNVRSALAEESATEALDFYHDVKDSVIYLQLSSMCESALFVQAIPSLDELAAMKESAFHQWFEAQECNHLKALLYLFNVCHHIIIMQPRPLFDVDLLRTFRLLQITRNKTAAATMTAIVNSLGLNERAKKKLPWTNLPGQFTPTVSLFFPSPTFAKHANKLIERRESERRDTEKEREKKEKRREKKKRRE